MAAPTPAHIMTTTRDTQAERGRGGRAAYPSGRRNSRPREGVRTPCAPQGARGYGRPPADRVGGWAGAQRPRTPRRGESGRRIYIDTGWVRGVNPSTRRRIYSRNTLRELDNIADYRSPSPSPSLIAFEITTPSGVGDVEDGEARGESS